MVGPHRERRGRESCAGPAACILRRRIIVPAGVGDRGHGRTACARRTGSRAHGTALDVCVGQVPTVAAVHTSTVWAFFAQHADAPVTVASSWRRGCMIKDVDPNLRRR